MFLFWAQGWTDVPELVDVARRSWELHNPGWNVVCLDARTINDWVDTPVIADGLPDARGYNRRLPLPGNAVTMQCASDIARLNLLARHGGVWADANLVCCRPLGEWIDSALAPSGFWMCHGGPDRMFAAGFLMVSQPGSVIASRWADAYNEFWTRRPQTYAYLAMDAVFMNLLASDREFRDSWRRVPYYACDWPDAVFAFGGTAPKGLQARPADEAVLAPIRAAVPFGVKLDHRLYAPGTNGSAVVDWALQPRHGPPVAWGEPPCDLYSVIRECDPTVGGWGPIVEGIQ